MSIRAQSADGMIHEFPDGTSDAVVDRAMKQYVAGQPAEPAPKPAAPRPSAKHTAADAVTGFVNGAAQSVRGMADTMMSNNPLLTIGGRTPTQTVSSAASGVLNALGMHGAAKLGQAIAASPDTEPQTEVGRFARTAGQMAPNALAPGGLAQRAANVLVPTVTTELAGRAAKALGANDQGVQLARMGGSVVGGLAANARLPAKPKAAAPAKVPTLDELRAAKNASYKAVDEAGVQYAPQASTRLADTVKAGLEEGMVDPDLHPKVTAVAKRVEALRDQPITLTKLDQIRRVIRDNVFTPTASKDERRLGHQMIDALDEFVATAGPEDVVSTGDPAKAAKALQQARELNTRVAKIEALEGAKTRAQNRTSQTGSGGNINNATRQEIGKVADRGRNWTPAEAEVLQKLRQGSKTQNALRQVGKLSPQGNGLMLAGHVYAGVKTGGISAVTAAAGAVAKHVADGMTKTMADDVVNLVAMGKDAQVAQMAAKDPKIASLARDLKGLRLDSSTVNALRGAGSGPGWTSPWQGSATPR